MGAGRWGAVGGSPMASVQTLLGAPQSGSHPSRVPWGSVLQWLGAGGLSPTAVRLCCGAQGSAPAGAVGWLDPPRGPVGFPIPWLLEVFIKTSLYFFLGWGCVPRGAPCPAVAAPLFPTPGAPTSQGRGVGAPTVPLPATGGHLHTSAGLTTPGTVPAAGHARATLALARAPCAFGGDPGIWEVILTSRIKDFS